MEIIYSFIGCFFALIIHDVIKKPKNKVKDSSLKREIPTLDITSIDISNDAIYVAEVNARENDENIRYFVRGGMNDD